MRIWAAAVVMMGLCLARSGHAAAPARVAIFLDARFPYYDGAQALSPRALAETLSEVGMESDLVDAAELADADGFNAERYAALVHLYGNSFPLPAFENVRRFHQAGGGIISAGVPFCHPCRPVLPRDWGATPTTPRSAVLDDAAAHSGRYSIRIENRVQDWVGVWSERLPAQAGERYRIAGWVRSAGNQADRDYLYIRFFRRTGEFFGQVGPATPADAAEWTRIAQEVAAPEGTAAIDVSMQVWSKGGTVWLDDVSLTRIGDDERALLANGDFETPGDEWMDLGHDSQWFSHETGMGTGDFRGPAREGVVATTADNDPLGLVAIQREWRGGESTQWLEPASLPKGDKVIGVIGLSRDGEHVGYPCAIIEHHCQQFEGAVDVWLGAQLLRPFDREYAYLTAQIAGRAVAYLLRRKGAIDEDEFTRVKDKMAKLPRPPAPLSDLPLHKEKSASPTFFPKPPPPARKLLVAEVGGLPREQRLLLTTLQGIVNRKQPRIYLIFNQHDTRWLRWMQERGDTGPEERVADPLALVARFGDEIEGAVVPDPDLFIGNHIAAMVGAVRDAVVAPADLAGRLGLPTVEDLRGRFKGNVEALRWVRGELLPQLSHDWAMCGHPNLAYNGSWDYVVQTRALVFWVTGRIDGQYPGCDSLEEQAAMEEIFADLPINIPIRGFWWHGDEIGLGEGPGVEFGGGFGKISVVSDGMANISVHAGVRIESLKHEVAPAPPFDRTKAYITFTMSDGDNLNTLYNYFPSYFESAEFGTFPMGWGLGPSGIDLIPAVLDWYYRRATPTDEFLADVSGVGYVFPETFGYRYRDREAVLDGFLDLTREYMRRTDMRAVRPHGGSPDRMRAYAARIPELNCIVADYARRGGMTYDQSLWWPSDRIPVFHAMTRWGGGVEGMVDEIREAVGDRRPAFLNVFVWNWGFRLDDLRRVLDELGPDYVAVTPSQLAELARAERDLSF